MMIKIYEKQSQDQIPSNSIPSKMGDPLSTNTHFPQRPQPLVPSQLCWMAFLLLYLPGRQMSAPRAQHSVAVALISVLLESKGPNGRGWASEPSACIASHDFITLCKWRYGSHRQGKFRLTTSRVNGRKMAKMNRKSLGAESWVTPAETQA